MLIQNLKCGHLCLIWSLVAVRIPRGTSSRAHSSTSRIFFGYACQRSRDLVLCHMLSQSQSLSYASASAESESQSSCVPTFNPKPKPNPNPVSHIPSQYSTRSPVVSYAQFWQKRWKFKIDHPAECLSKLPIASRAELSWAQAACRERSVRPCLCRVQAKT